MYEVRGYCAGILVFNEDVREDALRQFLDCKKGMLQRKELSVRFGDLGNVYVIREICIDVYDKAIGRYRADLSTAYKS